jgi:hypothetical protein
MSKPQPVPTRPEADDDNRPVTDYERRIVEERLAQPEGPTRPWAEVYEELKQSKRQPPAPR